MGKKEVNNEIVLMRHLVRKSRVRVIHNLTREIKILREKRGDEKKVAKFQRRAERLHSEVEAAKKIPDDEVTKFAIKNDKTLLSILNEPSSDATLRVTAKFADFPQLKERIVSFKAKFPDYEKFLGPGRKKLMKQEIKAVRKELKNKNKQKDNDKNDKKQNSDDDDSDKYSNDDDDDQDQKSEDEDEENVDDDDLDEREAEDDESVGKVESEEESESEEDESEEDETGGEDETEEDHQEIEKSDSEIDNDDEEAKNSDEQSNTPEEDDDENSDDPKTKITSKPENTEKLHQNSEKTKKSTKTAKQGEKSNFETKKRKKSPKVEKHLKIEKSKTEKEPKKPREIHPVSKEATVKKFSELLKETEEEKSEETREPSKKIKIETNLEELGFKTEEDDFFTTTQGDRKYTRCLFKKKTQNPKDDDDHEQMPVGKRFSRSQNESFFSNVHNIEGRSDKFRHKPNDRQNSNRKFEPKGKNRRDLEYRENKETKNAGKFDKKFEKKPVTSEEHLHPSWAARKKQQDALKIGFQGKKIVFADD